MATKTTFMTKLSSAITTIIVIVGGLVIVGAIVFSLTFQEPQYIPVATAAPKAAEAKWPMVPYLYFDYPAEQILDIWGIPYEITKTKVERYIDICEICYRDGIRTVKFSFINKEYPKRPRRYCKEISVEGPEVSSFNPWQGTTAKETRLKKWIW